MGSFPLLVLSLGLSNRATNLFKKIIRRFPLVWRRARRTLEVPSSGVSGLNLVAWHGMACLVFLKALSSLILQSFFTGFILLFFFFFLFSYSSRQYSTTFLFARRRLRNEIFLIFFRDVVGNILYILLFFTPSIHFDSIFFIWRTTRTVISTRRPHLILFEVVSLILLGPGVSLLSIFDNGNR